MTFPRESARYKIKHRTHYRYSDPVAICRNQLRMLPKQTDNSVFNVCCNSASVDIEPRPTSTLEHIDYFGNRVLSFSIESVHRELTVTAKSDVTVDCISDPMGLQSIPWEALSQRIADGSDLGWLVAQEYLYDSPRINRDRRFAEYAQSSFPPGRSVLECVSDLTNRIFADFKYDSDATDVFTTTEESFESRSGVCQDFSHIEIACLRSIGIPARYVSGYLRTVPPDGKERLIGADESHAWVSIYSGQQHGWVDFDPTNKCPANVNHIPICVGRDFSEVSPMRGVVIGGGNATLSVSVDVAPV